MKFPICRFIVSPHFMIHNIVPDICRSCRDRFFVADREGQWAARMDATITHAMVRVL